MTKNPEVPATLLLEIGDASVIAYILELIRNDLRTDFSCGRNHLDRDAAGGLAMFLSDHTTAASEPDEKEVQVRAA